MTAPPLEMPDPAPTRRVAWFSPMPPSSSGIAAYSAEILPRLRDRGVEVDIYVDPAQSPAAGPGLRAAHDFVWRHRRAPYDLVVYHLGNAACHDYMWGYLFRYPGLVVLHDAQVHQARARQLLGAWPSRRDDYLAEFAANHPGTPADIGLLVAEGLGGTLYGHWPLIRLVLQTARLAVVHSAALAARLAAAYEVEVRAIPMGVADPLADPAPIPPAVIRARHDLAADDVVVGAFGGLTPEKRLPQLLEALAWLAEDHPRLHLLLVGRAAAHYDVVADAAAAGVAARVHVTGYVPDEELPAYLRAVDIAACLRWPTNGETSASWLRAVAAGRPTIITDLAHQPEVPVVDPRHWHVHAPDPIAAAVPVLDEIVGLRAALDRLAGSASRRAALGAAARAWWVAHHTLDHMTEAYVDVLAAAAARPAPHLALPPHLRPTGADQLTALLAPFGVPAPLGLVD